MKSFLSFLFILFFFLLEACTGSDAVTLQREQKASADAAISYDKLRQQAVKAKLFCKGRSMNTDICLLADMSVHSGKQRLVAWDFRKDTVIVAGLVSHGCSDHPWGKDYTREKAIFSNQNDSHCSALGKYKVGERGYSEWGIHIKYLMHGLEKTNDKALERQIVLHGWDAIPDQEIYPDGTPEGWGCPAVSNAFMKKLDALLQHRERPVLLWLYQ